MMNSLKSDFQKDWKSIGVYHAKGLFKDLPNWESILNILNSAIRNKNSNMFFQPENDFEIVYKDLLAIKKLAYNESNYSKHTIESDATFFFSLVFNQDTFASTGFNSIKNQALELDEILDIKSTYYSLKISIADKFVPYEAHPWDTCIIHLAGTNDWKLRDKSIGLEKLYILEPGDILFFKEGIEHELSNELPRSSIVGRFTLGGSHEWKFKYNGWSSK